MPGWGEPFGLPLCFMVGWRDTGFPTDGMIRTPLVSHAERQPPQGRHPADFLSVSASPTLIPPSEGGGGARSADI